MLGSTRRWCWWYDRVHFDDIQAITASSRIEDILQIRIGTVRCGVRSCSKVNETGNYTIGVPRKLANITGDTKSSIPLQANPPDYHFPQLSQLPHNCLNSAKATITIVQVALVSGSRFKALDYRYHIEREQNDIVLKHRTRNFDEKHDCRLSVTLAFFHRCYTIAVFSFCHRFWIDWAKSRP